MLRFLYDFLNLRAIQCMLGVGRIAKCVAIPRMHDRVCKQGSLESFRCVAQAITSLFS